MLGAGGRLPRGQSPRVREAARARVLPSYPPFISFFVKLIYDETHKSTALSRYRTSPICPREDTDFVDLKPHVLNLASLRPAAGSKENTARQQLPVSLHVIRGPNREASFAFCAPNWLLKLCLFPSSSFSGTSPSTTPGPRRASHDVSCNQKVITHTGAPTLSCPAARPAPKIATSVRVAKTPPPQTGRSGGRLQPPRGQRATTDGRSPGGTGDPAP